ncbi:unnamed protein product [Candidula unifasciata]|uniref:LON peptidase N-terminal domain and RING finger protein 3 n=1 Tax=Candidula unifasciata TaxID=100452 RepID=A0A8S3YQJ3_9EUPU|nr:unnamed protein product [Candidula unifasciata]
MVDLAREAFITNNFCLAADIYERTIRENGPTAELYLGLADSLARGGMFAKAFQSYTNAYRFGKVTPEKLKHLVVGLIDTVKQDMINCGGNLLAKKNCMFTCGVCRGILDDPVTLPCGHSFCRKCLDKKSTNACESCSIIHYRLNISNLSSTVVLSNLVQKWFPKECMAARLKRKGNEYFSSQDYKNAVEMYSQALEISGTDHLLLSNRSHGYALMDRFEEALVDSQQVVQLCPDWPKGYLRKGCALYGLGRYEEAVVSFLQCLALDQNVSSAKEYLSKALDRILSAPPPDDPKAHTIQQQMNLSSLQQLIESNFSQPALLPNITHTLSNLACSVKDTMALAQSFSVEHKSQVFVSSSKENLQMAPLKQRGDSQKDAELQGDDLCEDENSDLKCRDISASHTHDDTENQTDAPEICSPKTRKRLRVPTSTTTTTPQGPVSPSHSSPEKVLKATDVNTGTTKTSPVTVTAKSQSSVTTSASSDGQKINPEQINIEDLECGLCYRLFYEPVTTPCGHTFCRQCLDRSLDHTVSCPMCKGNLAEYLAERRQAVTDAVQCIIQTYFREAYRERCKIHEEEMTELTRMGSSQQADIPIFVCIPAFPTIPCPLHVFEPRYRLMIRQCMESGTRQFGMCMSIGDSSEHFGDYGCMLEVRDVQYFPDGRSVVDTVGGRRFKVLSRGKRDGYNTAKVEFISDKPMDANELNEVNLLQTEIHAMVTNWLSRLPTMHRARITQHFGELPEIETHTAPSQNGPKWAWWAVAVLPIDPRVQMVLLAMSSLQERLIALKKVLVYMNRRGPR